MSAAPAISYQGDYAVVVDGPTAVDLGSTEEYTGTAYDPQGAVIGEVTFSRTFNTPGLVEVRRQMTITKPNGSKQTLYGALAVMVSSPGGAGGGSAEPVPEGAYFTNPSTQTSNIRDVTVDFINSASSEILVAAYTIESQEVADALMAAAKRLGSGKVKLVVEERNCADPDKKALYDALKSAGVQIVSDGSASGSLMHNKFVVVDGGKILTGSTNFTSTQFTSDANNSIVLADAGLAGAYAAEFNEMFSGKFDGDKSDNTSHTFTVKVRDGSGKININTASAGELASLPGIGVTAAQNIVNYREANGPFSSVQQLDKVPGIGSATVAKVAPLATTTGSGGSRDVPVESYFTPSDGVKEHLLDVINGAQKSIAFSVFTFTDPDIAAALEAAKARGVKIQGVFDAWQTKSSYSQYDDLLNAGVAVKKDGYSSLNHSKYLVADGSTVVTGSFNWTDAANGENDENILILRDATIASQYTGNFNLAYAAGQ